MKYFDVEPFFMAHTLRRRKEGMDYELDALAVAGKLAFIVEAKSSPKVEHVDATPEKASLFDRFYTEYAGKEIITILSGITFPEEVIKYASRKGVYILAYREWDYMDILNFQEVSRR